MFANTEYQPTEQRIPSPPVALLRWTAAALLGTLALLAGMIVLLDRGDWWPGLLGASIVSTFSAIASLPPLLWSLRSSGNAQQRLAAYFGAAGLRAIISLGGCVMAVKFGHYPAAPTLLMMVVFYFAVLAVETAVVARSLWDMKV